MVPTRTMIAALTLSLLALPAPALAKKKGRKSKRDQDITLTGLRSVDKVLRQVADIDERIDTAEHAMSSAKRNLVVALDLKKGTPLRDAIEELKVKGGDNLEVVLEGKTPRLTVADAAPSNIAEAAQAVNDMTDALATSLDELAGIPKEVKQLSKAVDNLPTKVRQEFEGDLIGSLFKAPKVLKTLKGNLEVTASLPGRSRDVATRGAEMVKLVSTTFTPATDPTRGSGRTRARTRTGGGTRGG